MASYELKPKSQAARRFGNMLCAALIIVFGVFLLMCYGLNSFGDISDKLLWLIALLLLMGGLFLIQGIFRANTTTFWFAFPFLVCAAVTALCSFTPLTYGQLYPLYIAIPAVGSAFTWLFSRAKSLHLKTIVFFGAIAGIFFLNSLGGEVITWGIIIPVLIVAIGVMVLINAVTARRGRWDDGDRPQRKKYIDEDDAPKKSKRGSDKEIYLGKDDKE